MLPKDLYDFTRCVRPNGSAYGTSGTCRKGVERPEEESLAQGTEEMLFQRLLAKRYSDNPEAKEKITSAYRSNRSLAEKAQEIDDGKTVIVANHLGLKFKQLIDDFNEVSLDIQMTTGKKPKVVSFAVNDEFDFGQIDDPRDRVKAAFAVRRMFKILTKILPPGALLSCSAYDGDGRGKERLRAYKKIGFSEQADGTLLGEVQEGGGVSPGHAYSESKSELVKWYVALFGEAPPKRFG
jgi:hypothetical protein